MLYGILLFITKKTNKHLQKKKTKLNLNPSQNFGLHEKKHEWKI